MPLCTFMSDFGLRDHYVASVKASIYQQLPQAVIVDITHQIRNGDLAQAAHTLKSIYRDFPQGTIHLAAVGTTSAKQDRHLALEHGGHWFIGPDNGLFPLSLGNIEGQKIELEKPSNYKSAFPSKYLYGQTVVHLLQNKPLEALGKALEEVAIKRSQEPHFHENKLSGRVIHVDHYGNLITNIAYAELVKYGNGKRHEIHFAHETIQKISNSYSDRDFGDCIVLFNSNGFLEIAINQGNASQLLGMKYNSPVTVHFFR